MKFICEKTDLNNAVSIASRAASVKSAIPALEGILAIAENNQLKLIGYNLETGIQTVIPANVTEPGSLVFPARLFSEIIRKLPDEGVLITSENDLMVHIESGVSSFNILGISAEDYPEIPNVEARQGFEVERCVLSSIIGKTVFSVATNDSKPVHTGCLFDIEGSQMTVVAVDGYRLALRKELIHNPSEEKMKFVVPGNALREVEKITGESDDLMKVTLGSRHVVFEIGDTVLISRILDGDFIDYKAAIPKSSRYAIAVQSDLLMNSVDRVSLMANEKLKNPILFTFEDQILRMECIANLGRAYDECPVDGDAEGLKIGFNNRYLMDALKACDQEEIILKLNTSESPCLLCPKEDDSYLYMVLPIRLRA